MDMNIVDILNTGVTGFAFLMLLLGYRLTSQVQTKILSQDPTGFKDATIFKEWKDLVCLQLSNTRYFMVFVVLVFVGGLTLLFLKPDARIVLSVTPEDASPKPQVRLQDKSIDLGARGSRLVLVRDEQNIVVSNEQLMKEITKLRLALEDQEETQRKLIKHSAASSADAGFGLPDEKP
jgi:hypothetical protein